MSLALIMGIWIFFPFGAEEFVVYLTTFAAIHLIVALGLNLFTGYCGQINFGPVGFYCLGAYGTVLFEKYLGLHFFVALIFTLFGCVFIGYIVGLAILRLRHFMIAVGTFAFAFITYLTVKTVATNVLGGDDGLDVPTLTFWGKPTGKFFYYYLVTGLAILSFIACNLLSNSKVGRAWKAIKGNEEAASAIGIDVAHYIRMAWLLCAFFGALAGGLYSQWNGWVSPSPFTLNSNWAFLVYIVVGGLGREAGVLVGTVIMFLIPELVLGFEQYALIVYATILFLVIRFMPRGIVGTLAGPTAKFISKRIMK